MHAAELDLDTTLVQRLLAEQYPALADQPVSLVHSLGTVNAIFRIGSRYCARLPRLLPWADSLQREWEWLPRLATRLPLQIPTPLFLGQPAAYYPAPWAIYGWLEGVPYQPDLVRDERQAARDLADFVIELRQGETQAAPRGGRRPLAELDAETRLAMEACGADFDLGAVRTAWARALDGPPWDGHPVWIHGDLLPPNLLLQDGRLQAVLDFGGVGVGDPAADVVPAWSVFGPAGRSVFRQALGVSASVWQRARGYALHQALLIIPYYRQTNPAFVALAQHTVRAVLADSA